MKHSTACSLLVAHCCVLAVACASLPPEIAAAKRELANGSYAQAEASAEKAMVQHPDHPVLWRVRIQAVHGQGQARRAVDLYRQWHGARGAHDRKVLERLALTTLWQGLRVPSTQVRTRTIQAVERQEVEQLADDVDRRMTDDSDPVAAAASVALLRSRPGAPRIVSQLLASESAQARAIAVEGIGRKIGKRARDDLLFALGDSAPRVRIAGIDAIAAIADDRDSERLRALVANDPDPEVRTRAAAGLAHGQRTGASDALRRALDDGDPRVTRAAALALAQLGERPALERWARATQSPGAVHAWAALGAEGQTEPPQVQQALQRATAAPDFATSWTSRAALADSLPALTPRADSVAKLRALGADADGRVAVAAAARLHDLDDSKAHELLSAACSHQDAEVREAAVLAHRERELLSPGLIDALADDSALVRVGAAEAILHAVSKR